MSPTATTKSPCALRNSPHDEHNRDHGTRRPTTVPVHRHRHLPRSRAHTAGPHATTGIRRRPVGFHRRGRAPSPNGPLPAPIRLHHHHRPALAADRQGADPGAARPHSRCRGPAPARLPHRPAADQLLQPALRGRRSSSAGSISGALLPSPNSTPISASNTWRSGATSSTPTTSSWASKAPVSAALPRK